MRFSTVALAATVSAAANVANLDAVKAPKFATAATFDAWSKYGKVEVDTVGGTKDVDVEFQAVYTKTVSTTNCPATTTAAPYIGGAVPIGKVAENTANLPVQLAASKTNLVKMAVEWSAIPWKKTDIAAAKIGTGTPLVPKTAAAGKFNPNLAITGTTACTASVTYTIPKAAANVEVAAIKTAGIKMATASYAVVKAANGVKAGCANIAGFSCKTDGVTPGSAVADGAVAQASTINGGAFIVGGLGVYQAIDQSGLTYMWGVTIKAATKTGNTSNDTKKKSATTLAVGAAAGLVAAAIA